MGGAGVAAAHVVAVVERHQPGQVGHHGLVGHGHLAALQRREEGGDVPVGQGVSVLVMVLGCSQRRAGPTARLRGAAAIGAWRAVRGPVGQHGRVGVSYRAQVAIAFEILAEGLAPFVDERMSAAYPNEDWILMAATKLGKRPDVLVSLSDPHFQLEVMNRWWGPAFCPPLAETIRVHRRRAAHGPQPLGPPRRGPPLRRRVRHPR